MSDQHTIDHEGVIDLIEGEVAKVRIISQSACASCHARGACSTMSASGGSEQEEKFIDVPLHGTIFRIGEKVRVLVTRSHGLRAVALGYVYPFLLLMVVLIVLTVSGMDELSSGLIALGSMIPYYLGLFIFRKRVGSKFTFRLQKI